MQPYDEARQQHLAGTSQWIVNEKVFVTWAENETVSTDIDSAYRNVLWIKGSVIPMELIPRLLTRKVDLEGKHLRLMLCSQ
jgi:hypothetical protein